MIHDTKNVGKPTVLTCRFPTFYGCLLHDINAQDLINQLVNEYSQDMAAKNQQIALLKIENNQLRKKVKTNEQGTRIHG